MLRAGSHDGVIAFGGGSALDAGKAIAFMAGQTRPMWDFEDIGDWWTRADPAGIAPIVAVPTTAGTGSEVGRAAVIIDESTAHEEDHLPSEDDAGGRHRRSRADRRPAAAHHCGDRHGCARALPGSLLRAVLSPLADGIALEGMRLVKEYLPRAVADGKDIEARAHMLAAASMGATAFQKGLGAIHSLTHPVGALYDTHHGLTNAVVMPYVLAFNRAGDRGEADAPGALSRPAEAGFDGCWTGCWRCARRSASRTRWRTWA